VSDPGTDLGTLGGTFSSGRAINASGQATGYSYLTGSTGPTHAFRTTATGLVSDAGTDLGVLPGFTGSEGDAINALGGVVGRSYNASSGGAIIDSHPFIYDTQMRDLNDLISTGSGWLITEAWGINDSGWITGQGTLDGQRHAFLLTPTGVPESSGLLLTGGALVGGWVVRRRAASRERPVGRHSR
jgi:probable HAF family extracellular repeat protein